MTFLERAKRALSRFHRDCLCEYEEAVLSDEIRDAVREEREACAKVLSALQDRDEVHSCETDECCASDAIERAIAAIRARS